jgi:DNA-binding transcriptional LysR family regulator
MERETLSHLPIVVSVARLGGFAAAAASLNMSPSAVSHAVRAVEDRLGEPLFARTTRSVRLTDAGSRFLASVGPALEEIEKAAEALASQRGEVTGVLRINAPRVAVLMALVPILKTLASLHPRLVVETHTNDGFVDIVAQGFDAGIRLGEAVQQDMVMVRLTPAFNAVMVASPDYLAARGEPATLADLSTHNCIGFRLLGSGSLYEWDVTDGERQVAVKTKGTAVITDATIAREFAVQGIGIAYIFEPLVRADLREGRLRWVLPEASLQEEGLFLYFPRRAALAPKLRAFIDAARSMNL